MKICTVNPALVDKRSKYSKFGGLGGKKALIYNYIVKIIIIWENFINNNKERYESSVGNTN